MTNRYLPTRIRFLIASLAVMLSAFHVFSQDNEWSINRSPLPEPTGFVNDFAGVIDAATKTALETKLKNFKETTNPSVEIAVAVVRTTGDRQISEYSIAVARGWKIGSKEDDNPSALLFVAVDDRKYFTQVSKDLEDELPDGLVGSLQRQYLVPEFRKGNYVKGISDTIDAYIATGDPFDKAGSYAIQHPVFQPVARIDGCYTNVVGLPLCTLQTMLAGIGCQGMTAQTGCTCKAEY